MVVTNIEVWVKIGEKGNLTYFAEKKQKQINKQKSRLTMVFLVRPELIIFNEFLGSSILSSG